MKHRIHLAVLFFCLPFCAFAQITASNQNPAGTIKPGKPGGTDKLSQVLDENFENTQSKWSVWENEASAAQIDKGNYRVNIKGNTYSTVWLPVPAIAADQSKDFSIETKIFLNSSDTGNAASSFWLLWGVGNDGKDFYAFGIYPDGKYKYGRQVNNEWGPISGSIASASVNAGIKKTNVIRVEKRGKDIFFFVNGAEVNKEKYEHFNGSHAGIGIQVFNKQIVDVDYLKVFQGTTSGMALSPEPYESDYQKKLKNANSSTERADAIIDYYLAVKQLSYTPEQLEGLLSQKFLQVVDIDYHGFYRVIMSKRINFDDVKLCIKASEVLTQKQRDAMKSLNQYSIDEFQAIQNNTTKPAYPAGVPQPGYGWGKTVSSNKTVAPVASVSPTVTSPLVGRLYIKDTSFRDAWGGYYSNVAMLVEINSVTGKEARVNYSFTHDATIRSKNMNVNYITSSSSGYRQAKKYYGMCGKCNGTGSIKQSSTSSHTNDYSYTLGQKHIYTTTTTSSQICGSCLGATLCPTDGSSPEWGRFSYSQAPKR